MSSTTLDRGRLLRDLRAAASETEGHRNGNLLVDERTAWMMGRAWLILAAAIEDGDYDARPEHRWPCPRFYVTAPKRWECTCGAAP